MLRSTRRGVLAGVLALLGLLYGLPLPVAAAAGSFQPVGNLTRARNAPTATLMADGTVLVTGGVGPDNGNEFILPMAELFDPRTNSFTAVGSMNTGRWVHAAVRLQDGQVLIVGGTADAQGSLASAEIYNPSTGSFSPVGDMTGPRENATATLLPDGRVLVVGGLDRAANKPLATAELFDPATSVFKATGSLAAPRTQHAAVALSDGRVAILGGLDDKNQAVRAVEIYDPASGTFTAKGEAVAERVALTATLVLGGKILLAGGYRLDARLGIVARNTVEIYDPATGQSAAAGTLGAARYFHVAVGLTDGTVLLAGGTRPGSGALRSAELADPAAGKVTLTASLAGERTQAAAVLLQDGRALILGGIRLTPAGDVTDLNTAEAYTP
jgi:Kelch motif/Galactose oxidase, central domain